MSNTQNKAGGQMVTVNGIQLYYEKSGQGKPLLLLHGWTQTSDFWQPYLSAFQPAYEVYAIDLRGHGRSTPIQGDFSIQRAAQDIQELVRKLNLKPVKAIGLSFGGLILLEIARTAPDLIESMVIIGTSYQYNGQDAQKNKPAFTYESLDPAFAAYLKQQHAHGENQIKALFDPRLDYQINIPEEALQKMQTKVFIINGEADEVAGITQAVEMRRLIPHSSLWIVPNTGHVAITDDNQTEFIRQTKAFFSR